MDGSATYSSDLRTQIASGFQLAAFGGLTMLDEQFRMQRARMVRDLAEKAIDPFIKNRLLSLAERYDVSRRPARTATTPIDLQYASHGTGPER